MVETLWDLDETGAGEQRVLSKKEREFLMTGDSGTYTTADMERRSATKAEKLPDRVQQLIEDVSLLHYRGYIGTDASSEIWENLLTVKNRSQTVRDSPIVRTVNQHSGAETNLGFEIASLLRMIHDDPVPTDLVWGVIVGLIGESSEEWETEVGNLVELFDDLEEQYEWRLFSAGAEAHQDDGFFEEREEIREILREQGFAPAPPLVNAVLLEYTNSGQSGLLERTEKSWRADPDQTEHPKPPDETPSPEEIRRTNLESIVSRLDEQTHLWSLDRLAKDLREDAIRIQSRQWRGVDPDQALRFVKQNGETQIQEFEQTTTKGQNNMTTALRRLAYEDSSWVNRPVLRENEGKNMYWDLTPYGELLYEVRVVHNCSTNWMYNFVVDQEHFDSQLDQLVSELV